MSASARVPGDPPSSHRAIENLIATYAELMDDGDFAGLGTLLAHATFTGSGVPVSGPDAIEKMFQDMLIVYDDGTPRTKHVTTNASSKPTRKRARRSRVRTSPCCRHCPACLCSPSPAAGTVIASSSATGSGASRSGTSASTSSAT